MNSLTSDTIAIIMLGLLLIMACFLASERGLESRSVLDSIQHLEARIDALEPIPSIEISGRATVYQASGEVVIDTGGTQRPSVILPAGSRN